MNYNNVTTNFVIDTASAFTTLHYYNNTTLHYCNTLLDNAKHIHIHTGAVFTGIIISTLFTEINNREANAMDGDRWRNLLEQVRAHRGLDYLKDMKIARDLN